SNVPVTAVTESGLYKVILQSRKPEALKFERWITHDVLPQIREHGAYVAAATKKTTLFLPKKEQYIADIIGKTAHNEETKKKKRGQKRTKHLYLRASSSQRMHSRTTTNQQRNTSL
ncbi:MAG: hypothetical protein LBB12_01680, partial [Holosporaceae bacterium]|nr:hypothetical protein [Holosporaceae bacterium]